MKFPAISYDKLKRDLTTKCGDERLQAQLTLTASGYKRYCTLCTCDVLAFPFLHIHGNCDLCMIPA